MGGTSRRRTPGAVDLCFWGCHVPGRVEGKEHNEQCILGGGEVLILEEISSGEILGGRQGQRVEGRRGDQCD